MLTKTDIVTAQENATAKQAVLALARAAILLELVGGKIPLELIFDANVAPRHHTGSFNLTSGANLGNRLDICTFSFRSDARLDRKNSRPPFAACPSR